jgi:ketosteroid isomerase-like protein
MSEENVEIVRQLYEEIQAAFESGEPGAWIESDAVADDYEWVVDPESFGEQRIYRGPEGFAEFMNDFTEGFTGFSFRVERVVDAGVDRVVGIVTLRGIGIASGAPVEWRAGQLGEMKDGRLIRTINYATPEAALKAAGLSE